MHQSYRTAAAYNKKPAREQGMITFILIFAGIIVLFAAWLIANGANQRKRARMAGESHVKSEQTGSGAPTVGRATGTN